MKARCLLFFFLIFNLSLLAQGPFCAGENGAQPFCSISGISFPNTNLTNTGQTIVAETGPDYGCLNTQPFPAWYFLQIENSGSIELLLVQNTNENGTGVGLDVDFIIYGPFEDPVTPCTSELTEANTVDCSFSSSDIEFININNALEGEFYLVLITNFSQQQGFITVTQTDGEGSTDCSILDIGLGPDITACEDELVVLDGFDEAASSYEWFLFDENISDFILIPNETSAELEVLNSGLYRLEIRNDEGDFDEDEINVTFIPNPTAQSSPQNLITCEVIDGEGDFNFFANSELILGTLNPLEYSVQFYANFDDATERNNELSLNYSSISTTIFARIESVELTDCHEIVSFDITVDPMPLITESDFTHKFCINNQVDNSFTLFSFNNELLDNLYDFNNNQVELLSFNEPLNIDQFDVSYHLTNTDAFFDLNPIIDSQTVFNNQELFIRVENIDTNCFNTASLRLIYEIYPELSVENLDPIIECSTIANNNNDISVFDLTIYEEDILSASSSNTAEVLYYLNSNDYDNNVNIDDDLISSFVNSTNPQTIIAAINDEESMCNDRPFITFDLQVEALRQLAAFDDSIIQACVNSDGSLQNVITIGEELIPEDGEQLIYDWTPDNLDLNNDGFEDAIFNVTDISLVNEYSLVITSVNSQNGITCSNESEPYVFNFEPLSTPIILDYEVLEDSFADSFTVRAIPVDFFGDILNLEFSINGGEFQSSPVFENVQAGENFVSVRSVLGCLPSVTSSGIIQIIDFPRFFTPNNDGVNDMWNIIDTSVPGNSVTSIFDRFGKLLTVITSDGPGWDGVFNGKVLPTDTYWFLVEFVEPRTFDTKVFKSSFVLKR